MTRILALTSMYPPHHYGGYELGCHDVAARWRAQGHDVAVLTSDIRVPGVDATGDDESDVERTLRLYWDDHVILTPPLRERLVIERHNQAALGATLRRFRPDDVSLWAMGAMSLNLLTTLVERHVPYVGVVQDEWLYYAPHIDQWAKLFLKHRRLGQFVRRMVNVPTVLPDIGAHGAFCFVSEITRHHALDNSAWSFPRSTVVWNGIDEAAFGPGDRSAPADRPWAWRLLYVGRIDERKGVDTLIRALPHLPASATLTVAGRGDNEHLAVLRALAEDAGVATRVTFTDVERPALAHLYRSADVVVFPSTWAEPFGLVPVEAMACGTPVVATGVGGSGEFCIDGVNCLLFAPRDVDGLVAAVDRLAGDPELRARVVAGGFDTASDLTVGRLADVLEAWHVAAASGYPDGPPPDRPAPRR